MTYLIVTELIDNGEPVTHVTHSATPAYAISAIETYYKKNCIKLLVVLKLINDEYDVIFIGRR